MKHRRIGTGSVPAGVLAGSEKKKLVAMSVGLVLLIIAFFFSRAKEDQYKQGEQGLVGDAPIPVERVEVPEIDVAAIERLVSDGSDEDRVLLEREAVERVFDVVRNFVPAHFEALGARPIDAELAQAILADPRAYRGEAFTARGWIESLRRRRPGGGRPEEYHGRLVREDDTVVYFIAGYLPDGLGEDEFVRVDGLFLKAFNDESSTETGKWLQGPLLVGPEVVRSYTELGTVAQLPQETFVDTSDDDVRGGITGVPFRAKWTLMAYVRDRAEDAVDWEAAPELDRETVTSMLADGSAWRGRPFRLPPSQIMGVWVRRPGENPARMEEETVGWIGNWNWTGEARVLQFSMPGAHPDLREGQLVQGRGFFLKNWAYEPRDGGMRLASMVVMDELVPFLRPEDHTVDQIWTAVIAMVVGLGGLLFVLVLRDRRRSRRVQANLRERRRARREDDSATSAPPAAP